MHMLILFIDWVNYKPDLNLITFDLLYQLNYATMLPVVPWLKICDTLKVLEWGQFINCTCNEIKSTTLMNCLLQCMAFHMAKL